MQKRTLGIVLLLGIINGVFGCTLLEQVGPPPALALYVEPFQAEVPYPFTILISVPEAGRFQGFQVEALSVVDPEGTEHRYQQGLPFIEEIRPFAFSYPSPAWSEDPELSQAGIYTVQLQGRFVTPSGRRGETVVRTADVFRGVVSGPLPEEALAQITVPVGYTLILGYPSRGYRVEVERGRSVDLPVRLRSRLADPLELHLVLGPDWRVPSGLELKAPIFALEPHGEMSARVVLRASSDMPPGDYKLYLLGIFSHGFEGRGGKTSPWPMALPLHVRVQ